jgi:hypothetical protein
MIYCKLSTPITCNQILFKTFSSGADPGFQVGGAHFKKLRRAEEGAKIFGAFRVKNHDFTPKNHIFSNYRGRPPWIRPCSWCAFFAGGWGVLRPLKSIDTPTKKFYIIVTLDFVSI